MGKKPRLGRPPGTEPAYHNVVENLRTSIRSGRRKTGHVLPSLQDLASEYNVGERVIRSAVEVLKSEGWVGVDVTFS